MITMFFEKYQRCLHECSLYQVTQPVDAPTKMGMQLILLILVLSQSIELSLYNQGNKPVLMVHVTHKFHKDMSTLYLPISL